VYRQLLTIMGQYYKGCFKKQNEENWKGLDPHNFNEGAKLTEHCYFDCNMLNALMGVIFHNPMQVVWAGDYADNEPNKEDNLYKLCEVVSAEIPTSIENFKYLVNHDKKQFIDFTKLQENKYGFIVNPLPLLTAEGNGEGNGDYYGTEKDKIGIWARDIISVESEKPTDFEEICIKFDNID